MSTTQVQDAKDQFAIEEWGAGYYSIDREGEVVCAPLGCVSKGAISLPQIVAAAQQQGVSTPMILRFPQIIRGQLERMHDAFARAVNEFQYQGRHCGVFPFKVNQRREFIDAIVNSGQSLGWGLEIGSKSEFMAALSYTLSEDSLFICNGFKDQEFVDMAFLAAEMGRKVILVIEGPDELLEIIERAGPERKSNFLIPQIGLRIRLASRGSGKWENSSGENSKFGLTTTELLYALDLVEKAELTSKLTMLHFHIGSQVTEIKRFKNALREAARVYAKVIKSGFAPRYLNIGGGVGVDYDGSQTAGQSSANYSLQQFANDAVYIIDEVCRNENVHPPDIVTESGRVIAAYHSVVVTDIREVQGLEDCSILPELKDEQIEYPHKQLNDLSFIRNNISVKNFIEYFHDAASLHEDLNTMFNLGYINLKDRAIAENLFHEVSLSTLNFGMQLRHLPDDLAALSKLKVTKYLANFSIFQSIPDAWSIDQLFPVMPLSRHNEKPMHKATIVDITCDSDGCIDRFIDRRIEKNSLDLHRPNGAPYYLGFFLVGAYQESLASEHNLFGAIHEVEVSMENGGNWRIDKITSGDPIKELLACRNYREEEILLSYKVQLGKAAASGLLSMQRQAQIVSKLAGYLNAYPYLYQANET